MHLITEPCSDAGIFRLDCDTKWLLLGKLGARFLLRYLAEQVLREPIIFWSLSDSVQNIKKTRVTAQVWDQRSYICEVNAIPTFLITIIIKIKHFSFCISACYRVIWISNRVNYFVGILMCLLVRDSVYTALCRCSTPT